MFFGGSGAAARRARRTGRPGTRGPRRIATVLAVTGIGLIGIGVAAHRSESIVPVTRTVRLHQQVSITYAATTARGAAYPTGTLRTGDPVFLRLVPRVKVHIAYRATPDADGPITSGLHGTRRVTAELRSANGWHRGFELLPRTAFNGSGFTATATLDLARVRGLITGLARSTGITDQVYTLSVRNEIALGGDVYDQAGPTDGYGTSTRNQLKESFFPELTFRYDHRQLQLVGPADPDRANRSAGLHRSSPAVVQQISSLGIVGTGYRHLDLLGRSVPLRPFRTGGPVVGLILLLIAGIGRRPRSAPRPAAPERPGSPKGPGAPEPITRRAPAPERVSRRATAPERRAAPEPTGRIILVDPRVRVPAQRSAATAQRHWARTHPTARERD